MAKKRENNRDRDRSFFVLKVEKRNILSSFALLKSKCTSHRLFKSVRLKESLPWHLKKTTEKRRKKQQQIYHRNVLHQKYIKITRHIKRSQTQAIRPLSLLSLCPVHLNMEHTNRVQTIAGILGKRRSSPALS